MSRVSKTLFGNQHLLTVAGAVRSGDQTFDSPAVQGITGLPPSTVHRTLQKFERAQLIARIGTSSKDRVQRYERRPHPFWAAVDVFAGVTEGDNGDADRSGAGAIGD